MTTQSQVPSEPGGAEQPVAGQAAPSALPEEGKEVPADQPISPEQLESEPVPEDEILIHPGRQMHKVPGVPKERPSREDWQPPGDEIKGFYPGDTNVYPDPENPVRSP